MKAVDVKKELIKQWENYCELYHYTKQKELFEDEKTRSNVYISNMSVLEDVYKNLFGCDLDPDNQKLLKIYREVERNM